MRVGIYGCAGMVGQNPSVLRQGGVILIASGVPLASCEAFFFFCHCEPLLRSNLHSCQRGRLLRKRAGLAMTGWGPWRTRMASVQPPAGSRTGRRWQTHLSWRRMARRSPITIVQLLLRRPYLRTRLLWPPRRPSHDYYVWCEKGASMWPAKAKGGRCLDGSGRGGRRPPNIRPEE